MSVMVSAFRNDLDENVGSLTSKFADAVKINRVGDNETDCQRIQQNIDQLEIWKGKWQI